MGNFIVDYIKNNDIKTISISTFMELALYDKKNGYYQQQGEKIGKQGDFITTSSVSPYFAKVICQWFYKQVKEEVCEPVFCEIGAGNGNFAYEFINHWQELTNLPLEYFIVEKSQYHLTKLKNKLSETNFFKIYDDLEQLPSINGVIFSNELFDAFRVDIVKYEQGQMFEAKVALNTLEELEITFEPCIHPLLLDYFSTYHLPIQPSYLYEVPLAMIDFYTKMCQKLIKGKIITVDYGYFHEELQCSTRKEGTLRAYKNHQLQPDFLLNVGTSDLTTHIHWDTLRQVGEHHQLITNEMTRQRDFLLQQGILDFLVATDGNPFSTQAKQNRKVRQLIMDDSLSMAFHVLIQQKNKDKV